MRSSNHSDQARTGEDALGQLLVDRPWVFDFFQVVWLFERYVAEQSLSGRGGPPAFEAIRFRSDVGMHFPATDVRRIQQTADLDTDGPAVTIDVSFLGLHGVSTPLPLRYAKEVLRTADAVRAATAEADAPRAEPGSAPSTSSSLRDFFELFNHRLISLFYRSGVKYRYDRTFGMPECDDITRYLRLLIGFLGDTEQTVQGVPPIRLLRYAGLLTQHPRSAATLRGMLSDYWGGLDVAVEQCTGRWVAISPGDQNRAGLANASLGVDLTVGDQIYDVGGSFKMAIGPIDWGTYETFLPSAHRYAEAGALTRLHCTDPLAFDLELHLHEHEIPMLLLSSEGDASRLGMTSWVRTSEMPETVVTFNVPLN